MNPQRLSPQGYNINDEPINTNPFFDVNNGGNLPPGGLTGYYLVKNSVQDYDAKWVETNFATDEQLKTQNENLLEIISQLETNVNGEISTVNQRIDDLDIPDISVIIAKVDAVDEKLDNNIEYTLNSIADINNWLSNLDDDVTNIESKIPTLNNAVSTIEDNLETHINDFNEFVSDTTVKLNSYDTEISELQTKLNNEVTARTNDVEDLQMQIDAIESGESPDLTELIERVTTLENDVEAIKNQQLLIDEKIEQETLDRETAVKALQKQGEDLAEQIIESASQTDSKLASLREEFNIALAASELRIARLENLQELDSQEFTNFQNKFAGGSTGKILGKNSDENFDFTFYDYPSGGSEDARITLLEETVNSTTIGNNKLRTDMDARWTNFLDLRNNITNLDANVGQVYTKISSGNALNTVGWRNK